MRTFVLAGGCFWCLDAVYRTLIGVKEVVSGYTGGHTPYPEYELVSMGGTGHAEAVKVVFEDTVIPSAVILDVFFTLHDPREWNRQGTDVGSQYRSAMFFADDAQRVEFEQARDRASEFWDGGLLTTIEPLGRWTDAENHHQNFFAKNPGQGYCLAIAVPKVNAVRRSFSQYVLTS